MARVISANGSFFSLIKKARIQNPKSSVSHAVGTALFKEPLPGVLGNKGTGAFIFREQGILLNYFQGTGELLITLLGTREHQSTFNNNGFKRVHVEYADPVAQPETTVIPSFCILPKERQFFYIYSAEKHCHLCRLAC